MADLVSKKPSTAQEIIRTIRHLKGDGRMLALVKVAEDYGDGFARAVRDAVNNPPPPKPGKRA